jgi:protoporphyrinogen oxidase
LNVTDPPAERFAIIIGAGPAGLTAAYELASRTDIRPIVLEMSSHMGGISRTVNYKGNRMDIGGHRFFSKSDRVMNWWLDILPFEAAAPNQGEFRYQGKSRPIPAQTGGAARRDSDSVMLIRNRLSRIYYMRRFFSYPISLSAQTLRNLGFQKVLRIGASYLRAALFPRKAEITLEDFLINRFGRELYLTFFKSYTEKVWGVPCDRISAKWGAQRIKGLSVYKTLVHGARQIAGRSKSTETSLIERFMYPKFGPGQMWEEVSRRVTALGGEILTGWVVDKLNQAGTSIQTVRARNIHTGEYRCFSGDYFFSTMPIQETVRAMEPPPPAAVREIAAGLIYRDFLIAGLLCKSPRLAKLKDNWIYLQDPDIQAGRMQLFHNWSPGMCADPSTQWVGLEYFCNDTDPIWLKTDAGILDLAQRELAAMELIQEGEVLDGAVVRMSKAYPAYFGTYDRLPEVIDWVNQLDNVFLIGRNGMHKYNNQDHSMLAAMTAVDNIIQGVKSRDNLWTLNTETDYHEEK